MSKTWVNGEAYGPTVRFPDGVVITEADFAQSPFRGWVWTDQPGTEPNPFDAAADAAERLAEVAYGSALSSTRDLYPDLMTLAESLRRSQDAPPVD